MKLTKRDRIIKRLIIIFLTLLTVLTFCLIGYMIIKGFWMWFILGYH